MMSTTKFYHLIEIILQMCSCNQTLVTPQPKLYKDLTRKNRFFQGCSWLKFNNLGLVLGTNLKFYTSMTKGLKIKVRKFLALILMFVQDTG